MTKRIEHFVFEYIPEQYARYSFTEYEPDRAWPPMVKIRVNYGSERYDLNLSTYTDDRMLTESFLEYLIRQAVGEFRKHISKQASEKARKALERKQQEFIKAADDYKNQALG